MWSQPRQKRLEVEDVGDVTVVNFTDKKILDEQNIQIIGEQLYSLVDVDKKKILLNFQNVEYMAAALLVKLITLQKKISMTNGKLVLCNVDPTIYEVFESTRLDTMFNLVKDEQGALTLF